MGSDVNENEIDESHLNMNTIENENEAKEIPNENENELRNKRSTGIWKPNKFTIIPNDANLITKIANEYIAKESLNKLTEKNKLELNQIARDHKIAEVDLLKEIKKKLDDKINQPHYVHVTQAIQLMNNDPISRNEALNRADRKKWIEAEQEEMNSIKKNQTWTLTELPAGRQPIGCKWVYKIKFNADGKLEKYKARLVAKGYTQQYGVDYTETFAPVARFASIRALLAIGAFYDLEIDHLDVNTAFLNGDIDCEAFMIQPEGYEEPDKEHLVCKLNKSLYGLKQAGRKWYEKIHHELSSLGFNYLQTDNCIYVGTKSENIIIIALYVDDLLLESNSRAELNELKGKLTAIFEMKDLGEIKSILGLKIQRDRTRRTIKISQTEYIKNILKHYNMSECSQKTQTPMNSGTILMKSETGENEVDQKLYQAIVGSVMYLMRHTSRHRLLS